MKVTSDNRQMDAGAAYRSVYQKEVSENAEKESMLPDTDRYDRASEALSGLNTEDNNSGFHVRSSAPKDSVGQPAAELARSETRMDVLQVLSKATRALASLKMSAYACEGEDAKKAAQMIKRMEKLIKRIQKKVKQLGKEEQLEIRQKKAEKQQEAERAKQIREELRSRRKKRRREERDYAMKELAEDGKESMKETLSSVIGAGAALSGPQTALYDSAGGIDLSAVSVDGMSIDLTV